MEFALDRNDASDAGFAKACLMSQAVTFEEYSKWAETIIENTDDYPSYILDIFDFSDRLAYISHMSQNMPSWVYWEPENESERDAIDGIAYSRFFENQSDAVKRIHALAALEKNPQIEANYRRLFPFIEW